MFKIVTSLFKFAFRALKRLGGNKRRLRKGTSGKPQGYIYTYDTNGEACDKCKPHNRSKLRVNKDGTKKVLREPFVIPPSQTHPNCDCILRSRKLRR
jgi:hypothetical protein